MAKKSHNLGVWLVPLFIFITVGFSFLPWLIQAWVTPPNQVFAGVNRWSADYYIYVSFVETGIRGKLKEYHLTTTKPQDPIWIHGIYTLSGYLGQHLGLDAVFTYHVDRLILGVLFVVLVYLFYLILFRRSSWALVGSLLVFWLPGFPKTLAIFGPWDNRYLAWIQELNIVGRSTSPPHYLLGFCLFILATWAFMTSKFSGLKKGLLVAFLLTLTTIANPVNWLIFMAAMGFYSFIFIIWQFWQFKDIAKVLARSRSLLLSATIALGGSLPAVWYYYQKLSIFPWGPRSNALHYYIPGNPINHLELILAIGPLFPLAILGILIWLVRVHKETTVHRPMMTFCLAWILMQFSFLFTAGARGVDPLRFLQGLYYLPLAGLATYAIFRLSQFLTTAITSNGRVVLKNSLVAVTIISGLLLLTLPTTVLSFREHLFMTTDLHSFSTLVFPTRKQHEAFKFMEKSTPFASGVLAFYEVTEILPAFSGNSTERDLSFADKIPFFANQYSPKEAREFLSKNHFQFIWDGYQERAPGFDPGRYLFLKKIFQNEEVTIYEVKN